LLRVEIKPIPGDRSDPRRLTIVIEDNTRHCACTKMVDCWKYLAGKMCTQLNKCIFRLSLILGMKAPKSNIW